MSTLLWRTFWVYWATYLAGNFLVHEFKKPCVGWECSVVHCPDTYAVRVKDKHYLPCELFEEYDRTGDDALLIKSQ